MNLRLTITALLLACTLPIAAQGLLDAVPQPVAFAVHTADTPALVEQWTESPVAHLWSDPAVKNFFAPLRTNIEIDSWDEQVLEYTGYELDDLISFLAGETIVYLPATTDLFDDGDEEPPLVIFAEVGERGEELEALLIRQEEKEDEEGDSDSSIIREIREFSGVDLHIDKQSTDDGFVESFTWAVFDDRVAIASTPDLVEHLILNSQEGAELGFGESEALLETLAKVSGHDAVLWCDLHFLQAGFKKQAMAEAAASQTPQMVSVEAIFDALGLANLGSGFAAIDFAEQGVKFTGGLTYSGGGGLIDVFAYPGINIPQPDFVPAKASTFGASVFDFEASWAAIETILDTINPAMRAMMAAQITAMAENAEVELDLRTDVLENLGRQLIVVQTPVAATSADLETTTPVPSQVVIVEILRRQAIESAVETLKTMFFQGSELFAKRDYLGATIHTFKQGDTGAGASTGQQAFSYAFTDHHLLVGIGDPASLEAVLVAMQKPGRSAWDRPEVKRALAALPPGAAAVEYQDISVSGYNGFNTLVTIGGNGDEPWVDGSAVPPRSVIAKYFGPGVSALYKDNESLTVRMRLLPPEGTAAAIVESGD